MGAAKECAPNLATFTKKVVLQLSKHGDIIETQTIRFVPPMFFSKLGPWADMIIEITILPEWVVVVTNMVASWLTGPHQENRQPQNSLIHVTSIRRANKLGQQTRQQNVIS